MLLSPGPRRSAAPGVTVAVALAVAGCLEPGTRPPAVPSVPATAIDARHPDLSYSAAEKLYLVVWSEGAQGSEDVVGARVRSNGAVVDLFPIAQGAGSQINPRVASDGTDFLVVWEDNQGPFASDVYATRVLGSSGVVVTLGGGVISGGPEFEGAPDVAFTAGNYLVVWQDNRNVPAGTGADVYGARVLANATLRDPAGIAIGARPQHDNTPAVAGNGNRFLVVWSSPNGADYDLFGGLVDPVPQQAVVTPVLVNDRATNQFGPAVAADAADFCVVWEDQVPATTRNQIYALGMTGAGVARGTGPVTELASDSARAPAVTYTGESFVAVWSEFTPGSPAFGTVEARFLLGCDPIRSNFEIQKLRSSLTAPEVGSDGGEWFTAVWFDLNPSGSACQICGETYRRDGFLAHPEFPVRQ